VRVKEMGQIMIGAAILGLLLSGQAPAPKYAGTVNQLGPVRVRGTGVAFGYVPLIDLQGRKRPSREIYVAIGIEVSNLSDTRKVDYEPWHASGPPSIDRRLATLRDEFGNDYRAIDFGIFDRADGQAQPASIHPRKSLTDLLVFEFPIDKANEFFLELPGGNVGEKGRFVFKLSYPEAAKGRRGKPKAKAAPKKKQGG
jgi:hypothetical protein